MSLREMGGNFCLTPQQIDLGKSGTAQFPDHFLNWENLTFTHSGRSAIMLAVKSLGLEGRKVIIPNFSCHSISDAFMASGCDCSYYRINRDLTVNIEDLVNLVEKLRPHIIYTCPYFGFDTIHDLRSYYPIFQTKGIKIIEDVSHLLFNEKASTTADAIVCSLRKWLEIPDGGFVGGLRLKIGKEFYETTPIQNEIVENFIEASKGKYRYLCGDSEDLKQIFLPKFNKNVQIFGQCEIYRMSEFSYNVLANANNEIIKNNRRRNYQFLLDNINNPNIEIIFNQLSVEIVPLYMQVYVKKEKRYALQKHLLHNQLYCPVIWPTPDKIEEYFDSIELANHREMLSLIVDQRYDLKDMNRLVEVINRFKI